MIRLAVFAAICAFTVSSHAGEQHVLARTKSPDKRIMIVEERADNGDRDYYFVQQPGGRKLGFVLPTDQRHEISKVSIVTSWNHSSSKVALLVFFGTKASELLLHSKDGDGQFQQIALQQPDAVAMYWQRTHRTIPQPGDGYSENAVGPWLDENTVQLVSGEAKQTKQQDEYTHVFVTFEARIQAGRATISNLQLKGPFSSDASKGFVRKWGRHFFTDDT